MLKKAIHLKDLLTMGQAMTKAHGKLAQLGVYQLSDDSWVELALENVNFEPKQWRWSRWLRDCANKRKERGGDLARLLREKDQQHG